MFHILEEKYSVEAKNNIKEKDVSVVKNFPTEKENLIIENKFLIESK